MGYLLLIIIMIFILLLFNPDNKILSNIYKWLLVFIAIISIMVLYFVVAEYYSYDPIYQILLRIPHNDKFNENTVTVTYISNNNSHETICYNSSFAQKYLKIKDQFPKFLSSLF